MRNFKIVLLSLYLLCCVQQYAMAKQLEGSAGDSLQWYIQNNTLYFVGTGDMYDYSNSYDRRPSWCYSSSIFHIVLPEGLTKIGNGAFCSLSYVTSLNIPSTVKRIGRFAFEGMKSLRTITVDERNPIYDSRGDCNAIIETATGAVILGCRNSILPETGITEIAEKAFQGQSNLLHIDLPEGITKLGIGAFQETGLKEIVIPSTVDTISQICFNQCRGLESISVMGDLKYVEDNYTFESAYIKELFWNCNSLSRFYCPTDSLEYVEIGPDIEVLKVCPAYDALLEVTLPGTIIELSDKVLSRRPKLIKADLNEGLEIIGNEAFYLCPNYKTSFIPSTVRSIGSKAFQGCMAPDTLICMAICPPSAPANDIFDEAVYNSTVLQIPDGCKELYASATGWSPFKNIVEIGSETRIRDITTMPFNPVLYDISGRVTTKRRGLVIDGDKTVFYR